MHEGALGDHSLDTVVQLASTSKMPSSSLLMALHEDPALDYDVEAGIDRYLPWEGVHGNPSSVQLVSNTSGIPGLSALPGYGPHLCQFTGNTTLQACGEILYTVPLPGTVPPGTRFDYGGTQWHLAGVVGLGVARVRRVGCLGGEVHALAKRLRGAERAGEVVFPAAHRHHSAHMLDRLLDQLCMIPC